MSLLSKDNTALHNFSSNKPQPLAKIRRRSISSNESSFDDSFKSPAEMFEQDLANATEPSPTKNAHRRRLRRHSSSEMRHKNAVVKQHAHMMEFLVDIKADCPDFERSMVDFVGTSGDEELTTGSTDKPTYSDSCPAVLSYFDSDGEDSVDLAKTRRSSIRSSKESGLTAFDESMESYEGTAGQPPAPAMTSYIMALPDEVSEDTRRDAFRRTKRRRSFARKRRARRTRLQEEAGTAGFHQSLGDFKFDHNADKQQNEFDWLQGCTEEELDELPNPDQEQDLGASLAAFLEDYHLNREEFDGSEDAVA